MLNNPNDPNPMFLLNLLLKTAQNNSHKKKNGFRHEKIMKMFAAYLKMIAGKLGNKIDDLLITRVEDSGGKVSEKFQIIFWEILFLDLRTCYNPIRMLTCMPSQLTKQFMPT